MYKTFSASGCLNKLVKDGYRERYDQWFAEGVYERTRGALIKAPALKLKIDWVLRAWSEEASNTIRKNLEAWGITTSDPTQIHCMKEGQPGDTAAAAILVDQEKNRDQ